MLLTKVEDAVHTDDDFDFIVKAVVDADEDFFSLLKDHLRDFESTVGSLVKDPLSDLGNGFLCHKDSRAAGVIAFDSFAENSARQLVSLRAYIQGARNTSDLRTDLTRFKRSKAPVVDTDCLYLSRIFVSEGYRGTGLARELMGLFLDRQQPSGQNLFLHVRRDNDRAVNFYAGLGFRTLAASADVQYLGMMKEA